MNSRTRVLETINHKQPDRIPLDLGVGLTCRIHVKFYHKLLEHFGLKEDVRCSSKSAQICIASDAVLERLECDVRTPTPVALPRPDPLSREWEDDDYFHFIDNWGTSFRMPKSTPLYYDMHEFPLAADPTKIADYPWVEPDLLDPAGVKSAVAYREAGYPIIFTDHFGNGFLQSAPRLFGFDEWLMMLGGGDDEVKIYLDRLLDIKMRYYDQLFDTYKDTLDIVCESDDLGMQGGPFVSPEMFREVFKPYWRKLFAYIKNKNSNVKIYMHSCGSVEALIGDLIDVGLDILNPIQISAANMEPASLKKKYGKDLVFWGGGVDTQKVLPQGTPAEVRENVKRNIDALAQDGGYVFATVHNIQSDVPLENFFAMWETFIENRNY